MTDTVQRVQARARELAGSGKFAGWRALAFELQFEPGFPEAYVPGIFTTSMIELAGLRGTRSRYETSQPVDAF